MPTAPGEPATAAPAADRRQSRQRGRLEVVGGRMPPGAREREQVGHGRLHLDDLGLGRPPAPHRDDDDAAVARHHPRDVPGDGRLADPLAGADHGDGRRPDRLEARRLEPEVGALVRHAERQSARGEPEPGGRPEHGLVREIEHDIGRVLEDRLLERRRERHAVLLAATQLLGAADEDAGDDLLRQLHEGVPDHGGVVLPVDHGDRSHERDCHLGLDPAGVLLVLEGVGRELDDALLSVERMAAPDVDMAAGDLDHVVTGPRVPPQAQRRDRAGVDDEEVLEPPRVRDVLVTGENELHAGPQQALDHVSRVVDDVSLPPGAGYGQEMVMQHEDPQVCGLSCELALDPRVAAAADLAVVEIGLGRVDRDDRHPALAQDAVALAEQLLEVHVADVARVVVPGDDDQ